MTTGGSPDLKILLVMRSCSQAMLFLAGIVFFGLGGVAAKELHGTYGMQARLRLSAGATSIRGVHCW